MSGSNEHYGTRRHDEKHTPGNGKHTLMLTKLDDEFWRLTGPTDPKGDRKAVVLKGKEQRWYVFARTDQPKAGTVYKKYLKEGGKPIASMDKLYSGITVPTIALSPKTKPKTKPKSKTKLRKAVPASKIKNSRPVTEDLGSL